MKAFAMAAVFFLVTLAFATPIEMSPRYMAFCSDGDGALTSWVVSRYDAYLEGREHERTSKGHRWEVITQDGEAGPKREPACAIVKPGDKPETVTVTNGCGRCVKVTVARTNPDGSVNAKEFTMKPNGSRKFRQPERSKVAVDFERDCPEQ